MFEAVDADFTATVLAQSQTVPVPADHPELVARCRRALSSALH